MHRVDQVFMEHEGTLPEFSLAIRDKGMVEYETGSYGTDRQDQQRQQHHERAFVGVVTTRTVAVARVVRSARAQIVHAMGIMMFGAFTRIFLGSMAVTVRIVGMIVMAVTMRIMNGVLDVPIVSKVVSNSAVLLREFALLGMGIVLRPSFSLGDDLRCGKLVRVLPDFDIGQVGISMVYPSRRLLSAKVRSFVEHVSARYPHPESDPWLA